MTKENHKFEDWLYVLKIESIEYNIHLDFVDLSIFRNYYEDGFTPFSCLISEMINNYLKEN